MKYLFIVILNLFLFSVSNAKGLDVQVLDEATIIDSLGEKGKVKALHLSVEAPYQKGSGFINPSFSELLLALKNKCNSMKNGELDIISISVNDDPAFQGSAKAICYTSP